MNHEMDLAGERVHLRPAGTLWLPAHDTLVVADLHLEKGSAYAMRGQLLPPYDTRDTLDRLTAEVEATRPQKLVLLGDSLHDMHAISRIGEDERQMLHDLSRSLELVWISGNHDPDGGSVFGGLTCESLRVGGLALCHEPKARLQSGEVAGHLHPCAKLKGAGGSLRRRCFLSDGQRMIMPAFGAYTGGLNVLDTAYDGLFAQAPDSFITGNKIVRVKLQQLVPDRPLPKRAPRAS